MYKICIYKCFLRNHVLSKHRRLYSHSWKSKRPWSKRNVSTANTRTSSGRSVMGCCGTAAEVEVEDPASLRPVVTTRTKLTCMTTTCSDTGTTNLRTSQTLRSCSWSTPITGIIYKTAKNRCKTRGRPTLFVEKWSRDQWIGLNLQYMYTEWLSLRAITVLVMVKLFGCWILDF